MAELGALSLRIQEEGGDVVLQKLRQIDGAAKITSNSATPLGQYFKRAGTDASSGLGRATVASKALNKEIADGTRLFALNARTVDVTSKIAVAELRASAAAQRDWLVSIGASTEQQERFNASVQRFEQRVARAGVVIPQTNRQVRSGAAAMAALTIAATTGGGSLAGMATQAGLVGSVMASEFAPAKWAGYAAGIGTAVIAVTALVGILARLRAEQAKPSPASLQRIEDIKQLTLAEEEYTKRRLDRERIATEVAQRPTGFLAPHEQAAQLTRAEKLRADLKKAETLEAEALKRFQELRNQSVIEGAEVAKDAIVQAAENTRTVRLSELAKEQAATTAAFQAGTATLQADYEKRRAAILEQEQLDRAVLERQRAQKLKPVAGETAEAAKGRRVEASAIAAEINALANATAARLSALDQQRAADERTLAGKVLAYEAQLEAVRDTGFQKRRAQIQVEAEERRKLVLQQTGDEAAATAARDELIGQRTTELLLQKAQADLARLQLSLDTARQAIQNDQAAGRLSELEASQRIADAERSAIPEMQRLVDLALQFATALGQDGAIAGLQKLRTELQGLGVDLLNPVLVAQKDVQSRLDGFGAQLGSTFADAIAAAASGGSGKSAILRGLGGIFGDMGRALIGYGAAMLKLLPALANPLTSGPAALAAGALLVALGAALGAVAGGQGAGAIAGAGVTSSSSPTPLSLSRLIVDPNAGVRARIASAGQQRIAGAAPHPLEGVTLLSVETPRGQQVIGTASDRYNRRRT